MTGGGAIMVANADLTSGADNQIAAFNDLTLAAGATLHLGGTNQTLSDLVITGDRIVDFGSTGSTLDLDTLSFIANATLTLVNRDFAIDRLHTHKNQARPPRRGSSPRTPPGRLGTRTARSRRAPPCLSLPPMA